MKIRRTTPRGFPSRKRAGLATLELVMSLAVFFTAAVVFYRVDVIACNKLHHIIASMVGSPYM
ncbi:MAG TPA: hypothetical protein VGP76_03590 [Planctomycetaceae bacterium]|jgi:hypothetical protein|nr:hypothetical protein [Planctomycetaceae bacterium]